MADQMIRTALTPGPLAVQLLATATGALLLTAVLLLMSLIHI